jgi:hypothetical protein
MSEMFKRVIHADWTTIIPIVSFWALFLVFLFATIRCLMMKKPEVERMAALPLDDTPPTRRHR